MHYIYIIKNSINEKVYIGQTFDLLQRKNWHLYSAKTGDNRILYQMMRKLGIDKFTFEILEICNKENASEREKYWITYFNSFNDGYNLTSGGGYHVGNLGRKFHYTTKQKMSAKSKNIPKTETHKKNISIAMRKYYENHKSNRKGAILSQEQKQHMSEVQKQLYATPRGLEIRKKISKTLTGRKQSEETIAKHRGKKASAETRKKAK